MSAERCPYCEARARMSVQYNVEVGPCPLHVPESAVTGREDER